MNEAFLELAQNHLMQDRYKQFDDDAKKIIAERAAELFELSNDVSNGYFNTLGKDRAYDKVKDKAGGSVTTPAIKAFCKEKGIPVRAISVSVCWTFKSMWGMMQYHVTTPAAFEAALKESKQSGPNSAIGGIRSTQKIKYKIRNDYEGDHPKWN